MASGSHTYSGIWADLPIAPTKSSTPISANVPWSTLAMLASIASKVNPSPPATKKSVNIPMINPKSPTRLSINALLAAFILARSLW